MRATPDPDWATKPTLVGERVTLRPFRDGDAELMQACFDEEAIRLTGSAHSTAEARRIAATDTPDERTRTWYATRNEQVDRLDLAVTGGEGSLVGEVVLNDWDPGNHCCGFRVLLGPAGRGKGFGTEATGLVLDHAFGVLGLHRVELEYYVFNPRAGAAYRKAGFVEEGRRRDALRFDGDWIDAVSMAVLVSDPRPGNPVASRRPATSRWRVRALPLHHPGTADHRSAGRLLWWLAKGQWHTLLLGMVFGIVWMSAQAVMPAVIGRAIDHGIAARDGSALLGYGAVLFTIGLVQAASGIVRHRYAVTNWLTAAYRTVQLIGRQTVQLGGTLPRKVSTGEVVAIGTTDLSHLGNLMDVSARFAGAIVSFLLVAVILLQTSVTLGLVVLVGVPVLMLLVGPLLRPLQTRSARQRELMGDLANTASDIVAGLRVLRGIGGEHVFLRRYRRESQRTRRAGVEVARLQSVLDALQVFLPGVFVVVVVWLGARYAVAGRISGGELVAFYGYAAFLMIPLRTATEYANKLIRARVSAQRVCQVLALTSDHVDPDRPAEPPAAGAELRDLRSGLRVRPGSLVAVVSDDPEEAARLADRLGMCAPVVDAEVLLGGVPLSEMRREDVRRRIVVSDTGALLFSGRLGTRLDVRGSGDVSRALDTASAEDVLVALPDGLDSVVAERGRTFSGGQRQRLVLARVLALDPEILVLVEPTSAVDAHTEMRIAARLSEHRAGRTTVVTTTSPLLLDAVDEVAFVSGGRVVATGRHQDLLEDEPGYRWVVTRETREEVLST